MGVIEFRHAAVVSCNVAYKGKNGGACHMGIMWMQSVMRELIKGCGASCTTDAL